MPRRACGPGTGSASPQIRNSKHVSNADPELGAFISTSHGLSQSHNNLVKYYPHLADEVTEELTD